MGRLLLNVLLSFAVLVKNVAGRTRFCWKRGNPRYQRGLIR
jgi:hypothetical protein